MTNKSNQHDPKSAQNDVVSIGDFYGHDIRIALLEKRLLIRMNY